MRKDLKLPNKPQHADSDKDAYGAWRKDKSPEAWDALYKKLQPTVDTALKNFGGSDPALKVRAKILTKQAVESYDPDNLRKATLPTHVYHTLKRLNRFREERSQPVYYPESVRNDRRAVYKYKQDFREKYHRDPTKDDIMNGMGVSKRRLIKALAPAADIPESGMESEKGQQVAVDITPAERRRLLRTDYVYQDQDSVGKKIMEWTMGYDGSKTLPKAEIASRLNISAPAVSKRITKIVNTIDAPEEYDQSTTDMRPVEDIETTGPGLSDDLIPTL